MSQQDLAKLDMKPLRIFFERHDLPQVLHLPEDKTWAIFESRIRLGILHNEIIEETVDRTLEFLDEMAAATSVTRDYYKNLPSGAELDYGLVSPFAKELEKLILAMLPTNYEQKVKLGRVDSTISDEV
jgi:hypothetical protein